jgi:hypothetical protein
MEYQLLLIGLGFSLGGAITVTLADAWLSRLLLMYLDVVEANLENLAKAVRTGSTELTITDVDLKRDGRQNRARTLKTLGWLALALGIGLQTAAAYVGKLP